MDVVPVADQRQDEEYEGDEQQSHGFGSVDRAAVLFVGLALGRGRRHGAIVAPGLGVCGLGLRWSDFVLREIPRPAAAPPPAESRGSTKSAGLRDDQLEVRLLTRPDT